jgi:hypothetical protein
MLQAIEQRWRSSKLERVHLQAFLKKQVLLSPVVPATAMCAPLCLPTADVHACYTTAAGHGHIMR